MKSLATIIFVLFGSTLYTYNQIQLDRHQLPQRVKLEKCRCNNVVTFSIKNVNCDNANGIQKSLPMNIQRIQEDRQMRYWLSYQIGRNARYLRPRRSEVKGGEKILFYTLNVMHRRMRHPWFLIRDQLRWSHLEELVRNVYFSLRSLCRKKERKLFISQVQTCIKI